MKAIIANQIASVYEMTVDEFKASVKACSMNRKVKDFAYVVKLAKSILETGIFAPIMVNKNTLEIIDGHHRVAAAEYINNLLHTNILVPFIFVTPKTEQFAALLAVNNINRNWNMRDYMESARRSDNPHVAAIYRFACEFGLTDRHLNPKLRIVSAYLGKNIEAILRSGNYATLEISDAEWKHARVNAISTQKMMRVMRLEGRTNNIAPFAAAWAIFRKSAEFKNLVISQKGEIAAMTYISKRFDWSYAVNKTRYLQGLVAAAK